MTSGIDTLPVVRVTLAGTALDDAAGGAILELEIVQRACEPASCELHLRDTDGELAQSLALGDALAVRFGAEQQSVFDGNVAAVEYVFGPARERELRVLAYDRLEPLRRRMPVRVHVDMTFADLARELGGAAGLTVVCPAGTPLRRRIVQHRRSDLDLLAQHAEHAGLAFRADGAVLRAYPAGGDDEPPIALTSGDNLREASVVRSDAEDAGAVDVRGWDVQRVEARRGNATGASSAPTLPLTNVVIDSDAGADALARAQLERRTRSGARLEAVAEGDARLLPGRRVTLQGATPALAGPYAISRATHRFSPVLGYVTQISTALPQPHAPAQAASATLGVVVDVRDPESLGRVKVKYPAVSDAESDWLQVLAAGAGGGKGLVALPAVGDNVLVLLIDEDFARGIVLGALYGKDGMPGPRKSALRGYAFYSPGGHVIELDDDGALSLHAAGGTFLELAKTSTTLHSENDLTIDVPGKNVTIRAQHVDIEQK